MDGDLVGGVEHARRRAAGDRGLAGQPQAGERLDVDGLEGQRADLGEVAAPRTGTSTRSGWCSA